VKAGAPVIVTFNLRHFPARALEPFQITAVHPQDYLLSLWSANQEVVMAKLAAIAKDHEEDIRKRTGILGKSVPKFSARVIGAVQ
jgi:hypothetical protein